MKAALLLIDLQHDFLAAAQLRPARERLIAAASALLERCRREGWKVVHVWTTIREDGEAMEHWRRQGRHLCREGTPGHRTPAVLAPHPGEWVVHKRGFSAFVEGNLADSLLQEEIDTLLLCGLHLRTCVRTTALDAYQCGFRVRIAATAIGDDDPLHAAVTHEYLAQRSIPLLAGDALEAALRGADIPWPTTVAHHSPRTGERLFHLTPLEAGAVRSAIRGLSRPVPGEGPRRQREVRVALSGLLDRLEAQSASLARCLAEEVGKPVRLAAEEVSHAAALVRSALATVPPEETFARGEGWWARRRPLGIVAAITPWNNPLAIPLGKLAPALLAGNSVAWKPALAGTGIARWLSETLAACGLPSDRLTLLNGDDGTAAALLAEPAIDGITLTGGPGAGAAAQVQAARRMLPLQAELGGNNAAIVWKDADLSRAATAVAAGAFAFAGQRCTANRRVIVPVSLVAPFRAALLGCIAALRWGDPLDPSTVVGPVISSPTLERLEGVIARSRQQGARVHQPHLLDTTQGERPLGGFWIPPTLIEAQDPTMEVVQEESFGPILALQVAEDWEEAIALLNGVEQGLAAALFSEDPVLQKSFLHRAEAGLLRLNRSTAGARAEAPFGGWKSSGVGPPEHGPTAFEAFVRIQAVEGIPAPTSASG